MYLTAVKKITFPSFATSETKMGKSKLIPLWAIKQIGFSSLFKKLYIALKTSSSNLLWFLKERSSRFETLTASGCIFLEGLMHKFNLFVTRGLTFLDLLQSTNLSLSIAEKNTSVIFAGGSLRRPVVSISKKTRLFIIKGAVEFEVDMFSMIPQIF